MVAAEVAGHELSSSSCAAPEVIAAVERRAMTSVDDSSTFMKPEAAIRYRWR